MDKQSNGHPEPPTDKYPPDPPDLCRYCRSPVRLVDVAELFNDPSYDGQVYLCSQCGASVGAHEETGAPIGYLADAELRRWRRVLRQALGPLWRETSIPRKEVMDILQEVLGVPDDRTHIEMLSISEIKNMVAWLMREGPELS